MQKSVLNTDLYDARVYREIRDASRRMRNLEERGSRKMPTFPPLLGDVWAGLFKAAPRILPEKEVAPEVRPNRALMEKIMDLPEFASLREYTRLDEVMSALASLRIGEKVLNLLEESGALAAVSEASAAAREAGEAGEKSRALEQAAEAAARAGQEEKAEELRKQAGAEKAKAARLKKKAGALGYEAAEKLRWYLEGEQGRKKLAEAVRQAREEARGEKAQIDALIGGLGYGTGPGQENRLSPQEALALADAVRENPVLQKVAELAGRAKVVAAARQKDRTREVVEQSDVEVGSDLASLVSSELLLYRRSRLEFLRRFAEGELLQYAREGKERLGRGPIVVCIDTSGSMRHKDPEAKAVMAALLAIAKKQKRAFVVVNFSNAGVCSVFEYPKPRLMRAGDLVRMVELFYGGGTDFQTPLDKALDIIKKSEFKNADIIFITDGDASVSENWLKNFLAEKKKRRFRVVAVNIGGYNTTLRKFADQVVEGRSLFEEKVLNVVLAV